MRRLRRIGAGCYELRTGPRELDRYRVERIESEAEGYGRGWHVSYPGSWAADDVLPTLAEARRAIDEHQAEAETTVDVVRMERGWWRVEVHRQGGASRLLGDYRSRERAHHAADDFNRWLREGPPAAVVDLVRRAGP